MIVLEALGPVRLEHPALIDPKPVRLAGRPWGEGRYGVRCRMIEELTALDEAIGTAIRQQWPEGAPAGLRHPIRTDSAGRWFYASAPLNDPPELFHVRSGEVFDGPGDGPLEGALALLSVDVVTYAPVPWATGIDIALRAVCVMEAGARNKSATSFSAALAGIRRRGVFRGKQLRR